MGWLKGVGILKIFLVGGGRDDWLSQKLETHTDMEPGEVRFHGALASYAESGMWLSRPYSRIA